MKTTATLSISASGLSCARVVHHLAKAGVLARVTPNASIVRGKGGAPMLETGCEVRMDVERKEDLRKTWRGLKDTFGLGCGHVKVGDAFSGCTKQYFSEK